MSIVITNLRKAQKIQASQKSRPTLGKKTLELNREYAILFPKQDNEVVAAAIIGRTASYDDLGISFIRISDDHLEVNPETDRIKDKSGLQAWASLSTLLYEAAHLKERAEAEEDAQKLAEKTGSKIDESSLKQKLEKIDIAYLGQQKHGDQPAILPTKTRLMGASVSFSVFTEALLVPLDKQLKPEYDNAQVVEVKLSPTKIKELNNILENDNYSDKNDPNGFLEIKFSYTGATPQEAGKKSFQGVETPIRKINLTKDESGNYTDSGTNSIKEKLADVGHDYETIFNRASTVTFAKTVKDAESAMRKFLSMNQILPTFIDMTSERLQKSAKEIIDIGCVFSKDSTQYKELLEMVEAGENKETQETENLQDEVSKNETSVPAATADVAKAKGSKQIADIVESDKELQEMMNSTDEIDDI